MNNRFCIIGAMWLSLAFVPACLSAQQPSAWRDPSHHTIGFVTVDQKSCKLEVLDWGGSGRPGGLYRRAKEWTGSHVFRRLRAQTHSRLPRYSRHHASGIWSSPVRQVMATAPDRLGDDVIAVLDALKIEKPVLAGISSIGGEELQFQSDRATRNAWPALSISTPRGRVCLL